MPFYSGKCRKAEILASKLTGKVTEFVQHQGIAVIAHTSSRCSTLEYLLKIIDLLNYNFLKRVSFLVMYAIEKKENVIQTS